MSASPWLLPALGWLVLAVVLGLAWSRQRVTSNAGIVDVIWSGSLGVLAVVYGALAEGWAPRRLLVTALAGIWSLRLTMHLYQRVTAEPEDGRYARLRAELGPRFDGWMFWFFQAQGVLAVLLSLAFLLPAQAGVEGWGVTDVIAVALWCTSLVGESIADRQLAQWRQSTENRGIVCRAGLWKYSRHPNYFFEWLQWLAYPLLALGAPYGWATFAAPLLMLFLILRVTGIPPTEEQALRSRGDAYRAYQRTTNAFFPGPPRTGGEPATSIR